MSHSSFPSSLHKFNGFKRLRNKQWIDNLYQKGKEKQQARSRSTFLTSQDAKDLKECSFHPKITHAFENNGYHSTKK